MYDTVRFYQRDYRIDPNMLSQYLSNCDAKTNVETGEIRYNEGYIGKAYIRVGIGWIYCDCSFPRLLYPDNSFTLKRMDAKACIEFLSDTLHYDMNNASVTRIDVATTFSMGQPVRMYFDCLGALSRFKRVVVVKDETLEYRQGTVDKEGQCLAFYDKQLESLEKRKLHPKGLVGDNLLRYEHRWFGRLATRLKEPEVTGGTLYDERFYRKIAELWGEDYFKIEKKKAVAAEAMRLIKTPNEAFNIITAHGLSKIPNEELIRYINQIANNAGFSANETYRLRKKIKEISSNPTITEDMSLAKELDVRILEVLDNLQ